MMSIAYIYLLLYLQFDEQFGITAKIETEKELHADFLLKRLSDIDVMTSATSNQIVENHGLF